MRGRGLSFSSSASQDFDGRHCRNLSLALHGGLRGCGNVLGCSIWMGGAAPLLEIGVVDGEVGMSSVEGSRPTFVKM